MADLLKAEPMASGLKVKLLQDSYKQPVLADIIIVVQTICHPPLPPPLM